MTVYRDLEAARGAELRRRHAVRGGPPDVVRPGLEEVAEVHHEAVFAREHGNPFATDVDFQAPSASLVIMGVLEKKREASVVAVRAVPQLPIRKLDRIHWRIVREYEHACRLRVILIEPIHGETKRK